MSLMELPFTAMYGRWFLILFIDSQKPIEEKINQEMDITWFKSNIDTEKLPLIRNGKVYCHSQGLSSKYYKQSLLVNNTQTNVPAQLQNFYYHYAQVRSLDIANGGIGFAFKYDDYNDSLVHQLNKEGLINHLIYSFVPNRYPSLGTIPNGTMYYGGIPNDIIYNKHQLSCKVNAKYDSWNCNLSYVLSGKDASFQNENKFYHNSHLAVFNVFESNIIAPDAFMLYLKETLFKPFIKDKSCEYYNFNINQYFCCKCSALTFFPDEITFVFNSNKVIIKKDILFDYHSESCYFNIVNHLRNTEKWVFGKRFLELFDSVFNYEEETITLYSNDQHFESIHLPKSSVMLWISVAFLLMIVIVIGLFALRGNRKKKERRSIRLITNSINNTII